MARRYHWLSSSISTSLQLTPRRRLTLLVRWTLSRVFSDLFSLLRERAPLTVLIQFVWVLEVLFNEIEANRNHIRQASDTSDVTRDSLIAYAAAVAEIKPRFPLLGGKDSLSFSWRDAYKTSKKCTGSNFALDESAAYFNLAALYATLGARENRNSPEGIKAANGHFQMAAALLDHLKSNLVSEIMGNVTTDLMEDNLGVLTLVMKAQSQECFVDKALKDGMKPKIAANLCKQAADYYDAAVQGCQSEQTLPSDPTSG